MNENIFAALSRLSPLATENQLTESLVALLRILLERSPAHGLGLANNLCNLPEEDGFDLSTLTLTTQVPTPHGIPDIGLWDGRTRAYIEVKHDSPLEIGQLEAYRRHLLACGMPRTRLVLLTRSKAWAAGTTLSPGEYHHVCWYEVHDWLDGQKCADEVSAYLAHSFTLFLEAKGMSIDRVSWEYMQGVPSMMRLSQMIEVAVADALPEERYVRTAGWSWRGLYLRRKVLFLGVRYDAPLVVVCENNNGNSPTYKQDLFLEKEHFFSLDAGEQLERLLKFVKEACDQSPEPPQSAAPAAPSQESEEPQGPSPTG